MCADRESSDTTKHVSTGKYVVIGALTTVSVLLCYMTLDTYFRVYTSPHENPWGMFDGVFLFAMAVVGTPLVSLTIFLSRRWLDVGASKLSPKKIFVNAFHLILASTAFFNALRILILIDVLR